MRRLIVLFLLLFFCWLPAQVRICSWNLCNMGKSKSHDAIVEMAAILKEFDVVALQEIVAGPGGAKAVAKLADALDRTGSKWSYCISDPTDGSSQKRERYAFLWKPSKITQVGKSWLDANYKNEVQREPYFGTFRYKSKEFTIVNFHAITKRLQPETEIKYFKFFPGKYPKLNLIFAGDFNCPQSHTVFRPLKRMGYRPALSGVKTTLRQTCNTDCTASEFDNFLFDTRNASVSGSGAIAFYKTMTTFEDARKLSDHLPIWMVLELK